LKFLAFAVPGSSKASPQPGQLFTVTYTDNTTFPFTQSISNYFKPENYAGEETAVTLAYVVGHDGKRPPNAKVNVYAYSRALNNGKMVKSITLPKNATVVLLAITLN